MSRTAPGWPWCMLVVGALAVACGGEVPPQSGELEVIGALYQALQGPDRQVVRISVMDTHDGEHVLVAYQKTASGQAASVLAQSIEALAREVEDCPEYDGVGVIVYSAESGVLGRALAARPDIEAWLEGRISTEQFRSQAILK